MVLCGGFLVFCRWLSSSSLLFHSQACDWFICRFSAVLQSASLLKIFSFVSLSVFSAFCLPVHFSPSVSIPACPVYSLDCLPACRLPASHSFLPARALSASAWQGLPRMPETFLPVLAFSCGKRFHFSSNYQQKK